MRNKIKMLKMCSMVLRFSQVHICSSDSSSTLLYTIEHDSEHDKWMRDQIGRSAFFDETEIAFLRQ